MTVEELFRQLSFGELSNLALSNDGNGTITKEAYPKLINYTNEALLRLYTNFVLSEKELLLELVTGITNYHLIPKYAFSSESGTSDKYIMDLAREPFIGDVIKVLEVYDQTACKVPLNNAEQLRSVYTPRATVLQVPYAATGNTLSVIYQAKHPKLSVDYLDEEIQLSDVLMGALRAHIAYSVYSHMNTDISTIKAQEHYSMYTAICDEVRETDTASTSISNTNTRFNRNGWV